MSSLWVIVLAVGAPLLGAYLWFRVGNSENGERYLKQRMQGPFVPTSAPMPKDESITPKGNK
jgi:hypothetical protein